MIFQTKSFNCEVKMLNEDERIVEGYFSTFDTIDSDNDIIEAGAFRKSVMERGPLAKNQIKFLSQHNPMQPLGPILELSEDHKGLKYKAKISKTSYGNDIYELIKDGSLNEHSIGFQVLRQKKDNEGINHITEIKLYEGSIVTWGSNSDTPITSIKSVGQLYDELEFITKKIRKGEIDDLTLLEIKLKQLQQAIEDLTPKNEPSTEEVTETIVDKSIEELELLKLFKESLTFLKK